MLCGTMPMMLRFSQEIRHYAVLLFFASLSYLFADRVASSPDDRPGAAAVMLSICLSLCVLSHSLGMAVLVSVSGYALLKGALESRRETGRSILKAVAPPLIVFVCVNFLFKESFMKDPETFWVPALTLDHFTTALLRTLGWTSVLQMKMQSAIAWPGPANMGFAVFTGAAGLAGPHSHLFSGDGKSPYPCFLRRCFTSGG